MVFNKILIPQDSFSRTTVTRRRIHRRKFVTLFQNHFIQNYIYFFAFILFFVYFYVLFWHGIWCYYYLSCFSKTYKNEQKIK